MFEGPFELRQCVIAYADRCDRAVLLGDAPRQEQENADNTICGISLTARIRKGGGKSGNRPAGAQKAILEQHRGTGSYSRRSDGKFAGGREEDERTSTFTGCASRPLPGALLQGRAKAA